MKQLISKLTFIFIGITTFKTYSQDAAFVGYATASVNIESISKINYVGYSVKEKFIDYDSSTIQPIGSVSKTFIGVSLMIAKEKGLLDLDEDINTYLDFELVNPHLKKPNKITLRHLATHTSGIVDNQKIYESSYAMGLEPTTKLGRYLKEYVSKDGSNYSKKNFNKAQPGNNYEYSNIASGLAAYIIEKVSGKPLMYLHEKIFLNL